MPDVKLISQSLIDSVSHKASESPRRRMNFNFHPSAEDNPHRFLNILLKDTYIRPHRHLDPPKAESFIVLEGVAELLIFDDHGTVTARHALGQTSAADGHIWGIDLPPGVWHTIIARTERVVCFEVKPGPWIPSTDKEFAPWAPPEGDPAVPVYLHSIS